MATVAEIEALLSAKDEMSKVIKKAAGNVDRDTGKMKKSLESVGKSMSTVGKKMTRNVTLPILGLGAAMVGLANRQAEAEAKMESTFESMGAAAWTNTEALKANARAIQGISTFGDEAVIDMQAVLLTFGDVTNQVGEGNDVFDKATMAIVDLSAKMGQDLQQSAVMVGKALNDPILGLTAMRRVGIQFTKQQEDQIKVMAESGDKLGAQKIILAELERQFGGTAEKMAGTDAGKMKQAMNTLGDAGEQLGNIITPVLAKIAGGLKVVGEWFQKLTPGQKEWVVRMLAVAAAVGPVLFVVGKLIASFGAVGKAFGVLSKLLMANPWILLIAATVALVVLIVKNWDTIVAFLKKTWDWIKSAVASVGKWFQDKFRQAVDFVRGLFLNFTPLGLIIKHMDKIKGLVTGVKDWIIRMFTAAVDWLGGIGAKISGAMRGAWDGVKSGVKSAINFVINLVNKAIGGINTLIGGINKLPGVNIPNIPSIPRLHEGGVFRAPTPGGEGLAILKDRERVVPADSSDVRGSDGPVIGTVNIQGNTDPMQIGDFLAWRLRTAGV